MATYHLHANTISRGGATTATKNYNYITRQGKWSDRDDLIAVFSGNMPAWAESPEDFWRAADMYERENGRLCKTIEAALPKEMGVDVALEIARIMAEHYATPAPDERMPYSAAVHCGPDGNIHIHIMISERITDDQIRTPRQHFSRATPKPKPGATSRPRKVGGARKSILLKPKAWLYYARAEYADCVNHYYAQHNLPYRIDHRSYKAQGKDKLPGTHIGPRLMAVANRLGIDNTKIARDKITRNMLRAQLNQQHDQQQSSDDVMRSATICIDNGKYPINERKQNMVYDPADDDGPRLR